MRHRTTQVVAALSFALILIGGIRPATAQPAASRPQPPLTVLSSDVVYTVNIDGTYTRDETTRVRLNTPQAMQRQAQSYFPHNDALESFEVIEAATETADGQRIPVAKNQIFTQQSPVSTNAPAFGDVKITAIVFPQMSPGAVKSYHVRKTETQPLFARNFSMLEVFPVHVGIKSAKVTLIAPKALGMKVEAIGLEGGRVKAGSPGQAKWVWTLEDAKARGPEPGSVNFLDYSPRVAATSFADFQAAAKAYLDGAADKARVTEKIQKRADKITQGIKDPREKAQALYQWVSNHIRYVALNFGLGGVVPREAEDVLKTGYGDCKDHVVLLGALLAAEGIASSPVLVNAQNVYWQPKIAVTPGVYNHAITYLPEFDLFLDSTAQVAPFGVLPITELGKSALITRTAKGTATLTTLPLPAPSSSASEVTTTIEIDDNGSAEGHSTINFSGTLELIGRAVAHSIPQGQDAQVANALMAAFGQVGKGNLSPGDPLALEEPFVMKTKFSMPDLAILPGPGAMPVPLGVPSPTTIAALTRATVLPQRSLSFVCTPMDKSAITTITLPDTVKVQRLPAAVKLENEMGHYNATYSQEGRVVHVMRRLVLTPRSATCTPENYQALRALGQAVARDLRAQIFY